MHQHYIEMKYAETNVSVFAQHVQNNVQFTPENLAMP